ncbi:putative siderophore biosynthesis [Zymoseptoria tritici IPO323]|uniref:Acyltransferase MYCGRDRAFT_85486 n=1 Tax=Zymoseptoria tritici (strain CBS 115943 / IPO323) TaxID=336722 RepID=FER5_ZYMTI|nr:putative siderophore biosynthesis [Zymoseptoria tritici IPO323]F9X9V2.1 RecName: Full=Acyltransferase MYCGRDRAFT_85486; AltName: Full=Ferrichrome A-like siderophore biosynthesis protein MYCGRDRAFT_85486 [Zymoseptoria tritici IPO323]EGP87766.1 putative siderophore biosynthesis [Zymoseptoria tritici IPO323]
MTTTTTTTALTFTLPDGTSTVTIRPTQKAAPSEEPSQDTAPSKKDSNHEVYLNDHLIATWVIDPSVKTRVSPAQVLDERAEFDSVRHLVLSSRRSNDNGHTWISIYALWLLHHDLDVIPISSPSNSAVTTYLINTGLAAPSPFEPADTDAGRTLLLAREAFWQGAGTPDNLSWLRSRPEASIPGFNSHLGAFASQMSFTRRGNVCTTHPLRPQKPAPGTVVYSRYIVEVGQHLQLVHIDASNPVHFSAYARWQNSDRVNHGWRERGPDEKHAAYLESQRIDPHTMSLIFLWDGEPAGYSEVGWAKEDNTACFVSSNCGIHIGEFDQLSHILVGEEKFRGGKRYQAVATSIKHLCFLRDPRTTQVIAEPRFDLPSVPIQARFLPQERKKRVQLPHKQAVLFALQRERFFQEGHFY